MDQEFRSGVLPLFGVSPDIDCDRFLGGWSRQGKVTASLCLGHRPREGSIEDQLRVETWRADAFHDDRVQDLGEELWLESRRPPADLPQEEFRSYMRSIRESYDPDAIEWRPLPVEVDGVMRTMRSMQLGDHWVAFARGAETSLVLEGHAWPREGVQLVGVTDLEPYFVGSHRPWPRG